MKITHASVEKTFLSVMLIITFSFLLMSQTVYAQEVVEEEDKFSMTLAVTADQFFGFAPMATGALTFSKKFQFTFYGIYWSGGTGGNWGNWTEFGMGVNFIPVEGLDINPQLGIVGGNLLSSYTEGPAIFGDGIVPNLTVGLDKSKVEGELYFGYYAPLRQKFDELSTASYIHYWANAGYQITRYFSAGAHWEHLYGGPKNGEDDVYQWIGPYIQFSALKGNLFTRFSGGPDLLKANDSFFKLTFGYSFGG